MSDINIEGKNLKNIDQSNFQSVGPYTDTNQVTEPWQGRNNIDGNDEDKRFELGTYTENDRQFWEIQTADKRSRKSQFIKKSIKSARSYIREDNDLVISDETEWSVDTFPYVKDQESDETIPLYFYYDKHLHSTEYNNATIGKINFRIELREDGRDGLGNIDNFLPREPFRPFSFGFNINAFSTDANGEPEGEGAYNVGDYVTVQINMDDTSYFERWTKLNDDGIPASFPDFTKSFNNPMNFNMIKEDFELTANIRPNPIIKLTSRVNGQESEVASTLWFGSQTELTNNVDLSEQVGGLAINLAQGDFTFMDTIQERNTFKPDSTIKIIHKKLGDEFEFENYSYLGSDGEVILEDEDPHPALENIDKIGTHTILPQPEYPEGILQIYANFAILLAYIRSFNDWIATQSAGQSISHRLIWGYGGGSSYDDWTQIILDSTLGIRLNVDENGGYTNGDYFWYQVDSAESAQPSSGIWLTTQPFDEALLRTLNDSDDDYYSDGVRLTIPRDNLALSDLGTQITGTRDAYHYIGRRFIQQGVYIKITKTEDSHDFAIAEPNSVNKLRDREYSPEINADMYQLGGNLQWSFTPNLNFEQGQVGEMPVIQSITRWDDVDKALNDEDSSILSAFDMTYNQDGNSMVLTYNPPNSIDDDLYVKYFEFVMKSTIVPPALLEFLGIFELLFQSNNDSYGNVSLLQEADEIPQTTYIGKYGQQGPESQDGDDIETPTYAHTLGEWIDGDYNPSGLDINIINDDAQVGILTVSKHPTFDNVIEEILGYDYFNNWVTTGRNFALLNNIGSYLNLQITNNNSLSITPEPNNNSSINDDIEEFLSFVNQNRSVPRIPIRINAFFELIRTININRLAPGRWTTNWDQAAYEANPGMANVDTWTDDSRIQSAPTSSDIEDATITVPDQFFNGTRELIIRVGIAPSSGADGPNPLISGASDIGLNIEEISAFQYNLKITGVSNSFTITLDWNGLV